MSAQFKVGERVKCLETSCCGGFIKNEYYTLLSVSSEWIRAIDSDGMLNGWGVEHFVKIFKLKRKLK